MSVYVNPHKHAMKDTTIPAISNAARSIAEHSHSEQTAQPAEDNHMSRLTLIPTQLLEPRALVPAVEDRIPVTAQCPQCGEGFTVHLLKDSPNGRSSLIRTCLRCRLFLTLSVEDCSVTKTEPAGFSMRTPIGRQGPYPLVACSADGYPLKASFHHPEDPCWYAVCVSHRSIMGVTRADYSGWLDLNDPDFLAARLAVEASGGKKIVTSDSPSRSGTHE